MTLQPSRRSCLLTLTRDGRAAGMTPPAYFERQSRQLCLRHTLNNLLQQSACTTADLDAIAAELPGGDRWVGPHRTVWLGNYDVNILNLALARHSKVRRRAKQCLLPARSFLSEALRHRALFDAVMHKSCKARCAVPCLLRSGFGASMNSGWQGSHTLFHRDDRDTHAALACLRGTATCRACFDRECCFCRRCGGTTTETVTCSL